MSEECVILLYPEGKPDDVCNELKKEYFSRLGKGVSRFRIIVVTDEPIREWIEYVKCVLETNIAATIRVDQVKPGSEESIKSGENVVIIPRK